MNTKRALKRFLTAFVAAVLLMSACTPAALASFKAKINTTTRAYNIPSTSGKSVRAAKGLTVTVTSTSGNWAKISYKGHTAYIPISKLNLVNRVTAYTAKSTPVYRSASSSASQMGTLSIGTAVYVVGKSGGYYRIQNSSGSVTGYVSSGNLTTKAKLTAAYNAYKKSKAPSSSKPAPSTPDSSSGNSSSSRLVSVLKSLCGRPYGFNPPSSFSCSTLVKYALAQFGISTKGTAATQATDDSMTKISSLSSLKVGDILCFDEEGDGVCDHTAIFIGGNQFVEASRNAGKVHINTLDSWYKAHFMWARRP